MFRLIMLETGGAIRFPGYNATKLTGCEGGGR
jgi:hypothetical protein